MVPWEFALTGALVIYIAVCFGKIAARHGKNPILYGFLSIISPINLIILGIWAFSNPDKRR
jgi:hypothetical protein